MTCINPECLLVWCKRCIISHYSRPEDPPFVADGRFVCPVCRGTCLCLNHRRRRAGLTPSNAGRKRAPEEIEDEQRRLALAGEALMGAGMGMGESVVKRGKRREHDISRDGFVGNLIALQREALPTSTTTAAAARRGAHVHEDDDDDGAMSDVTDLDMDMYEEVDEEDYFACSDDEAKYHARLVETRGPLLVRDEDRPPVWIEGPLRRRRKTLDVTAEGNSHRTAALEARAGEDDGQVFIVMDVLDPELFPSGGSGEEVTTEGEQQQQQQQPQPQQSLPSPADSGSFHRPAADAEDSSSPSVSNELSPPPTSIPSDSPLPSPLATSPPPILTENENENDNDVDMVPSQRSPDDAKTLDQLLCEDWDESPSDSAAGQEAAECSTPSAWQQHTTPPSPAITNPSQSPATDHREFEPRSYSPGTEFDVASPIDIVTGGTDELVTSACLELELQRPSYLPSHYESSTPPTIFSHSRPQNTTPMMLVEPASAPLAMAFFSKPAADLVQFTDEEMGSTHARSLTISSFPVIQRASSPALSNAGSVSLAFDSDSTAAVVGDRATPSRATIATSIFSNHRYTTGSGIVGDELLGFPVPAPESAVMSFVGSPERPRPSSLLEREEEEHDTFSSSSSRARNGFPSSPSSLSKIQSASTAGGRLLQTAPHVKPEDDGDGEDWEPDAPWQPDF
ncbi:hypothetical protein T439DRAFT_320417 [Meredithblackwellia eburnea MCA 4105]